MGDVACDLMCKEPKFIQQLVSMATLEAVSFGPAGLAGMKVVEYQPQIVSLPYFLYAVSSNLPMDLLRDHIKCRMYRLVIYSNKDSLYNSMHHHTVIHLDIILTRLQDNERSLCRLHKDIHSKDIWLHLMLHIPHKL